MIPATRIRPRTLGHLLVALALTAVLAGCEASLPTAEDVRSLDVVSLERSMQAVGVSDLEKADYFVNGTAATAEAALALAPETIAAIRVIKALVGKDGLPGNGDGLTQVRIVTRDATDATDQVDMVALRADVQAPSRMQRVAATTQGSGVSPDPLVFIDDAQVDFEAMRALSPDRIASLTVLKDEIAVKEYGTRAANGVIMITTKQ